MKKIFALCGLVLVMGAGLAWKSLAGPNRFGVFISAERADVSALISNPTSFLDKTVSVEGTITQQCRSMGCFFYFRSGNNSLRIDLQDIAMHAPMKEGRAAHVEGQLVPYDGAYQLSASAVEFR